MINKIVFTSPEAMVEFSGKKIKLRRLACVPGEILRFCFGSEAVNASGEAVRGLVKSLVEFSPAQIRGLF